MSRFPPTSSQKGQKYIPFSNLQQSSSLSDRIHTQIRISLFAVHQLCSKVDAYVLYCKLLFPVMRFRCCWGGRVLAGGRTSCYLNTIWVLWGIRGRVPTFPKTATQ